MNTKNFKNEDVREKNYAEMKGQVRFLKNADGKINEKFLKARPCCVCGSEKYLTLFRSVDDFSYVKCSSCGFVYVTPILNKKGWNMLAAKIKDYEHVANAPYTEYSLSKKGISEDKKRFNAYLDIIENYMKKGNVLDVGSHTGNFLLEAKARGYGVLGIEMVGDRVKIANSRGIRTEIGTFDEVCRRIDGQTFDLVTMWETLEHIEDPVGTIKLASKILNPEGIVAITVPNINSAKIMILKGKCTDCFGIGHINMFSEKTLKLLFAKNNFEVILCKNISSKADGINRIAKRILDTMGLGPLIFCVAKRT